MNTVHITGGLKLRFGIDVMSPFGPLPSPGPVTLTTEHGTIYSGSTMFMQFQPDGSQIVTVADKDPWPAPRNRKERRGARRRALIQVAALKEFEPF